MTTLANKSRFGSGTSTGAKMPTKTREAEPDVAPKRIIGRPVQKGQVLSPATTWKPGQSGNPAGRTSNKPVTDAIKAMMAEPYTGPSKKWKDRNYTNAQAMVAKQLEMAVIHGDMRAAEELTNRLEGRVVTVSQVQGANGGPLEIEISALSPEQKTARIAELQAKMLLNTKNPDSE